VQGSGGLTVSVLDYGAVVQSLRRQLVPITAKNPRDPA